MKLVPESMLKGLRTFSHQLLVGWRRFVATAVGFGDKETRSTFAVSSLSFLGLGMADSIPFRACFLQPVSMHKLLTQAALDS